MRSMELGQAARDDIGDLIIGQRLVGGSITTTERTETGILLDPQVATMRSAVRAIDGHWCSTSR